MCFLAGVALGEEAASASLLPSVQSTICSPPQQLTLAHLLSKDLQQHLGRSGRGQGPQLDALVPHLRSGAWAGWASATDSYELLS